jgi:6-phosphogluconolactonase
MCGPEIPDCFVYVGCRTTRERNARGDGINVYRMNSVSGRWVHIQLLDGLLNPSFLAINRSGTRLYTVHGDSNEVSSFRIDQTTGRITALNRQSTEGRNPVHLAFDASERFLVVANHVTSTVAVLPVDENGAVGQLTDLVPLTGKNGPHRVEQPFPKPHQVVFDQDRRFMIIPDKGLDCVFSFCLDSESGKLVAADPGRVTTRENAGPRHAAFHPQMPWAYVLNELDSTITAYGYDRETGGLSPFQLLSSLPDTYTGDSRAAELEVSADGRFVYVSNRGFDSIGVFSVDPGTGRLRPSQWVASGGKTPRFFATDPTGRFAYVANEDSDAIVCFERDTSSGKLSATEHIVQTGSPVCILFRQMSHG